MRHGVTILISYANATLAMARQASLHRIGLTLREKLHIVQIANLRQDDKRKSSCLLGPVLQYCAFAGFQRRSSGLNPSTGQGSGRRSLKWWVHSIPRENGILSRLLKGRLPSAEIGPAYHLGLYLTVCILALHSRLRFVSPLAHHPKS